MQCSQCGKTGFVTLGGKRFCSNCGAKLEASAAPMATMADIKTGGKPLDLRSATPTPTKAAAAVYAAERQAKPAGQFHGQQGGGSAVLDLRAAKTKTPAPQPVVTPKPAAAPTAVTVPQPSPAPAATTTPSISITPKKPMVIAKPPVPQPKAAPISATPPTQSTSPMINRYPANPTVNPPAATVMPEAVAAQLDTMNSRPANLPVSPQPQSPALHQALAAAKQSTAVPSLVKIGAAVVAIGIMGGVVWLQNSPKLAFRDAATRAGIEASLPTYIPSSYHQAGGISTSPGTLTLNFTSPVAAQPLKIIQRQSGWDANALRENYVNNQSTTFSAIQGQGLTIYMFDNQANWINHGVWYQLSGTSKLARNDVLKIAYGL